MKINWNRFWKSFDRWLNIAVIICIFGVLLQLFLGGCVKRELAVPAEAICEAMLPLPTAVADDSLQTKTEIYELYVRYNAACEVE